MDADARPARITADDSELARTIKAAIIASQYRNVKNAEAATGLPQALTVFIRAPLRLSAPRRHRVMVALHQLLGLPVERLAVLAGLLPDGTAPGADAPRGIEGLTPRQATAATAFRSLVGRRPWPGLDPDSIIWATWGDDLRRAWRALRAADSVFAAAHPRAQVPSFAVWRVVVDGEKPGFALVAGGDEDLAALERQALAAGLDALAALLVPAEPIPAPEPITAPVVVETPPTPAPEPAPPPPAPIPAPAPPAPRPTTPAKAGKRGRPAKETALSLRVRAAMEARGISSVADLEHRAGLTVDGFRDILRGKVGRNRAAKLAAVERVAAILRIPVAELAALAGLIEVERKTDRGTAELQLRREALAAGGDARVCWSALGVLLAHGELAERLGLAQDHHDTGRKFADMVTRQLPGAPRRPRSELERFAYPGGRHDADLEAMELRSDAARLAWKALLAADRGAAALIRGPRPSAMVWAVAVQDRLPRWASPDAAGPWSPEALAEWLALRYGLRVLRQHFRRSEDHRAVVVALKDREEARRWGDVAHQRGAAEAMLARRGVRT